MQILDITDEGFSFSILTNFREWRGYYFACVDEYPYQCDMGIMEKGKLIQEEIDTKAKVKIYDTKYETFYDKDYSGDFNLIMGS